MLSSLDPHSSYMNAKNFRDMQVQTRGEFGGLGIEVTMENGLVKVVSPIDDTPAARAGHEARRPHHPSRRRAGAGPDLAGSGREDARPGQQRDQADGPPRHAASRSKSKLTRARSPIQSVRSRLEGEYRLYPHHLVQRADRRRPEQRDRRSCKQQAGNKLKGLVLDLRNNPGGLLDQAVAVSDAFLDKGEIVSTRGRRDGRRAALQRASRATSPTACRWWC